MRERGDCRVFHEPFLAYYYKHVADKELPLYDESLIEQTDYSHIRQSLFAAAERGPVFFKDMSYYVVPRIFEDRQLNQQVRHLFIIRDPRRAIASFYKLDPRFTLQELGLEAQWQHYCHLAGSSETPPLVIEAETMAQCPEQTMRLVWRYCGLPYIASALHWQAEKPPADWRHVAGWHERAVASSGINADTVDAREVFEEAALQAPELRRYLQHHQPFYEKLKSRALTLDNVKSITQELP